MQSVLVLCVFSNMYLGHQMVRGSLGRVAVLVGVSPEASATSRRHGASSATASNGSPERGPGTHARRTARPAGHPRPPHSAARRTARPAGHHAAGTEGRAGQVKAETGRARQRRRVDGPHG